MSNTRPCRECNQPHWHSGPLCFDCREDEIRPYSQLIIDENRWWESRRQAESEYGVEIARTCRVQPRRKFDPNRWRNKHRRRKDHGNKPPRTP
jgi:hypothetical protein